MSLTDIEVRLIETLKSLNGEGFTNQIKKRIRDIYPNDDGYKFRWAQQSLKRKELLTFTVVGNRYLWKITNKEIIDEAT